MLHRNDKNPSFGPPQTCRASVDWRTHDKRCRDGMASNKDAVREAVISQTAGVVQEKNSVLLSEKNPQGKTCGKRHETGVAATKITGVFGYNGPQSIGHLPDRGPAMSAFA